MGFPAFIIPGSMVMVQIDGLHYIPTRTERGPSSAERMFRPQLNSAAPLVLHSL